MAYSNFHNHTKFCDGRHTPEEMVLAAIAARCPSIGFSGHSYTCFDESYCMSKAGTEHYKSEIVRLQQIYGDRIRILCGIEQDYWSQEPTDGYDFVIGSVHYVKKNGHYLPVDNSKEELLAGVNGQYGGDLLSFCEDYYHQIADVLNKTHCTFVGHFDLVTKFNEDDCLFSTTDPRYVRAALEAVDTLCAQGALFEINTGAIAKGYRATPYPAPWILERIRDQGGKVVLSSDCHDQEKLLFGLPEAEALANQIGVPIVREL